MFQKEGFLAEPYHAGLPDKMRSTIQNDWMQGKVNVICATIGEFTNYYNKELYINPINNYIIF